jgi:glycosidase
MKNRMLLMMISAIISIQCSVFSQDKIPNRKSKKMSVSNHKLVVYQCFIRIFGNKNNTNKVYGSIEENGSGKFNDIDDKALKEIKKLGTTHVWLFGALDHLTMTDYTKFGIPNDNPWLIKGKAGSPFAVKDYYDVAPDLAEDVPNRMKEFEAVVNRVHSNGMKAVMDFVPNHVARYYHSDVKPAGVQDFGQNDDTTKAFSNQNNFYYLPNQKLESFKGVKLPNGIEAKQWIETPAKATGNDVFTNKPSVDDWYETIKLNYGVDYQNNREKHFEPLPDTWLKMRDILLFWAKKGIDGVRCDMAEMVPVEFWAWAIPQIKAYNKDFIFIAEIYNPAEYHNYINIGKFDYLYDKVGLYDALRRLMEGNGNANDITKVWQNESGDLGKNMLRFLENHDEQRINSEYFAKDAYAAIPAMTLSATLHDGPIMIYSGQEFGEQGMEREGFHGQNGTDGRSTMFDYWSLSTLNRWKNGGKYDGKLLTDDEKRLYDFYKSIGKLAQSNHAISNGSFYDLQYANMNGQSLNYNDQKIYTFLRHSYKQRLIIVCNFDLNNSYNTEIKIPRHAWESMYLNPDKTHNLTEIFRNQPLLLKSSKEGSIQLNLPANSVFVFEIK